MAREPSSSTPTPVPVQSVSRRRAEPPAATSIGVECLPKLLTSLIGREADVAAVRDLLLTTRVRLLTLTGPGGVGKTRLALCVAEEVALAFPDGVVFVPLAPIGDSELVLPTVARALGVRDAGQSLGAILTTFLRERRMLLVLDNFEQVAAAASQIAALLSACPGLNALVTSRALLRVAGEQRFPVAPLALPDVVPATASRTDDRDLAVIAAAPAVQLFAARARAVDPRFEIDRDNAGTIASICRRLDGLPLAIELASARARLFSPRELRGRLHPALPLLTGGPEDVPDRLRAMRSAIAWSYDLLPPDERRLFRRLAIFVGGFTLEAAELVGGEGVLDLVASLVDKSLLQRTEVAEGSRFAMLETIREYGLEQLEQSGEGAAIAGRHAAWCIDLAEGVRRTGLVSQRVGLGILEIEHPNLRAALAWLLARGETTSALHLMGNLAEFWLRHGHIVEGREWLERALDADHGEPTAARAEALVGLNMLHWPQNALERAEQLLAEAESTARAVGDAGVLAYARLHQGYIAAYRRDVDLAAARGEECLATAEAIPQEFSLHGALWLAASAALYRGQDDRATELYGRLLASARSGGDEISVTNAQYGLAVLAARAADPVSALAGFAEAAATCQGYGDRFHASYCLEGVATCAVALGRPEPATRLFAAANALRTALVAGPPVLAFAPLGHEQDQAVAAARGALGEATFAGAWEAGTGLSVHEAIDEASRLAQLVTVPNPVTLRAVDHLTNREREVLRFLVVGWSDKEIAGALGIGWRTVSNHVAAIRSKLGAPSRSAAAAIAVRDRLV